MHDPSERRGIWFRETRGMLEVCGGREGDDSYVKLEVGKELSQDDLRALATVLDTSRWVLEDYEIPEVRGRANVKLREEP